MVIGMAMIQFLENILFFKLLQSSFDAGTAEMELFKWG